MKNINILNDFINKGKNYQINSIDELFNDSFSEFIGILNDIDLSTETIQNLYDVFLKDLSIFKELYTKYN